MQTAKTMRERRDGSGERGREGKKEREGGREWERGTNIYLIATKYQECVGCINYVSILMSQNVLVLQENIMLICNWGNRLSEMRRFP